MTAPEYTYDSLMEKRRKLYSEAATATSVAAVSENRFRDLAPRISVKKADIQIIVEQIEFMSRPKIVASLGAYRDLCAELELYTQQLKKLKSDHDFEVAEHRKQTHIATKLWTEIKCIDDRMRKHGKILILCRPP